MGKDFESMADFMERPDLRGLGVAIGGLWSILETPMNGMELIQELLRELLETCWDEAYKEAQRIGCTIDELLKEPQSQQKPPCGGGEERTMANDEKVIARIDSACGYCKGTVTSTDKYCRYCGAELIADTDFDQMDSYAMEYAARR